jgi:chemotaxis protein histidine kinase CheA
MSGLDEDILNELVEASREYLGEIESFLRDENGQCGPIDSELWARFHRSVGGMRSGFGFFGYAGVVELSLVLESALLALERRDLDLSQELAAALLSGVTKLGAMIENREASGTLEIKREVEGIQAFLTRG